MEPDLSKLMQQASAMQEQLMAAQNELAAATFSGTAGGGMVTATVTGGGQVVSVDIDPAVIDPDDSQMLGDLVVAALNQAFRASSDAAAQQMGGLAGGLDLGSLGPGNPAG